MTPLDKSIAVLGCDGTRAVVEIFRPAVNLKEANDHRFLPLHTRITDPRRAAG
ncbi:MAG: hypothetical protein ABI444_11915 [Candidatus Kapaibacterium sp.]|jgi:hypothetical protein